MVARPPLVQFHVPSLKGCLKASPRDSAIGQDRTSEPLEKIASCSGEHLTVGVALDHPSNFNFQSRACHDSKDHCIEVRA